MMIKTSLFLVVLVTISSLRASVISPIRADNCTPIATCNSTGYKNYDWTRGVIKSSDSDVFDKDFLICQYSRYLCGWVPGKKENDEYYVTGKKGIHISLGVDLGSMNSSEFNYTLGNFSTAKPSDINATIEKITKYFSVQGGTASRILIANPVNLTNEEETAIFNAFTLKTSKALEAEYNEKKGNNSTEFAKLPFGVKTAIFSFAWQFGNISNRSAALWEALLKNDYVAMVQAYDNGKFEDADKRKREKQIIVASTQKCSKSVDIAFLIDESGSVGSVPFEKAKTFMADFVKAQESIGPQATRVAVSTYDNSERPILHLNSGLGKDEILKSISGIRYNSGGTYTGKAMKTLIDRIEKERRTSESISMVLIVITDGETETSDKTLLSQQSDRAKSLGIMTIAVGVGNYKINELNIIANQDKDRVFEVTNYAALEKFLQALSASSCSTRIIPQFNVTLSGIIKSPIEPIYYEVSFNTSKNLRFALNVTNGTQNGTQMYISFRDKYPDALMNDKNHSGKTNSTLKEIVVMAPDNQTATAIAYLSVSGEDELSYKIAINECDQAECLVGSNEIFEKQEDPKTEEGQKTGDNKGNASKGSSLWVLWLVLAILVIAGIAYVLFNRHKQRAAYEASMNQESSNMYTPLSHA